MIEIKNNNIEEIPDISLKEKLEMFNFEKTEEDLAISRYAFTLKKVHYKDLLVAKEFLESQGINITKAKELKVLSHAIQVLKNKVSLMNEAHELELYRMNPSKINLNAMDLWKKFQYCTKNNISYKNDDNTYKNFLFSEKEFQEATGREEATPVFEHPHIVTEDTFSPEPIVSETSVPDITMEINTNLTDVEELKPEGIIDSQSPIEINNFNFDNIDVPTTANIPMNSSDNNGPIDDFRNIEQESINFEQLRNSVERDLASLESDSFDSVPEIDFNSLQPEEYGYSRVRDNRRDDAA